MDVLLIVIDVVVGYDVHGTNGFHANTTHKHGGLGGSIACSVVTVEVNVVGFNPATD